MHLFDKCVYLNGISRLAIIQLFRAYIERGVNKIKLTKEKYERRESYKVYDKILKLFSNMHKHISSTHGQYLAHNTSDNAHARN